jgi:hypothetical protein
MLTNQGSGTISRCAQNSPRLGRQLLTGIQMNFDNLKSILVLDDDHEINLINNDWLVPNSTAKCDTLQYQAANVISLKTIAGCLKSKHFFGR